MFQGLEELRMYIKSLLKDDDGVQLYEKLNASYHLLNNIGSVFVVYYNIPLSRNVRLRVSLSNITAYSRAMRVLCSRSFTNL